MLVTTAWAAPTKTIMERATHTGRGVWYLPGGTPGIPSGTPGTCGYTNTNQDLVVGLSPQLFPEDDFCGRTVVITNTNNNFTATAQVVNECTTFLCPSTDDIEMSTTLFTTLGGYLIFGTFPVIWNFE
ncbi:hypothetical protein TREMEDRAFT_64249 [Tremella mesenterica DSM 1558]|nr:uncharacterized protein TREMEDRAFT_64249 [Tremella mesenterica DSM 1558]EIW67654.1 hypothetical protein TREMEDRAFT_64249 [Tremella mesenterica DSM 1558]